MSTIPQQYEQHPTSDIPLPAGAVFGDTWEGDGPQRVVMGQTRGITDSDFTVWTSAIQCADGRIDSEPPEVHIAGDTDSGLNSDQARELAAALLEAAAEMDAWLR
jgi:hypothetical protein